MAGFDENEEIPISSPITFGEDVEDVTQDEEQFSTLVDLEKKFRKALFELSADFKVLDTRDDMPEEKAAVLLLQDVKTNKKAYKKLEPLYVQLKSAVDDIKAKNGGR